ncbi:MAG: hypothetical protein AAF206_26935 [Bacteroidota bacterium]
MTDSIISWLEAITTTAPLTLITIVVLLWWLMERLQLARTTRIILLFSALMVGEIAAGTFAQAKIGGHWFPYTAITIVLLLGTFSALKNELRISSGEKRDRLEKNGKLSGWQEITSEKITITAEKHDS